MIRVKFQVVALLVTVLALSCAEPVGAFFNLTLMHTGQTFDQITAVDPNDSPCQLANGTYFSTTNSTPCLGGMERRSGVINQVRSTRNNSLLIDSGGLFTGSLFWYIFNSTLTAKYYDLLGYQAIGLSVYEFLPEVPALVNFIRLINGTPTVAANLENWQIDPRFANETIYPFALFEFNSSASGKVTTEKVGYISTLVPNIVNFFQNSKPINSSAELPAIIKAVGELQDQHGVNKIILTVSTLGDLSQLLSGVVGIDVVVLSDVFYMNIPANDTEYINNTALPLPQGPYPVVNYTTWGQPVLVVGSGSYGTHIGVLDITFNDYGVPMLWNGNSVELNDNVPVDPFIAQLVSHDNALLNNDSSRVIGFDAAPLSFQTDCLFSECAIGDWVAQVLRSFGKTQIGLCNAGFFYTGLPAGPVTLADFMLSMPYGTNQL
jgi:5'-nucleotidase/UDP-sugar diphosphatase